MNELTNLHYFFYKKYFSDVDFRYLLDEVSAPKSTVELIGEKNKTLLNNNYSVSGKNKGGKLIKECIIPSPVAEPDFFDFDLKVAYPGLVTGIGITHEVKIEGEFKLGMHFDWTRGMPVIYGSSVKGALRSAFKEGYVDQAFVSRINTENPGLNIPDWVGEARNRSLLIEDIFEGKNGGKNKSIYERDVFFDAVIVQTDSKGRILCSDSITPHGGETRDNPLKNPTPLTFVKIAAGCALQFRFKLKDTTIEGLTTFTAEQKKKLFEALLTTVGVGAKTNVGYGQLTAH